MRGRSEWPPIRKRWHRRQPSSGHVQPRQRRTARTSSTARSSASSSPSCSSPSVLPATAMRASRVKNSRAACSVVPRAAPICSQVAPARAPTQFDPGKGVQARSRHEPTRAAHRAGRPVTHVQRLSPWHQVSTTGGAASSGESCHEPGGGRRRSGRDPQADVRSRCPGTAGGLRDVPTGGTSASHTLPSFHADSCLRASAVISRAPSADRANFSWPVAD